jgi:hypothetical protein
MTNVRPIRRPACNLRESIAIAAHETTILRVSEFWRR